MTFIQVGRITIPRSTKIGKKNKAILGLRREGETFRAIGKRYDLSMQQIRMICINTEGLENIKCPLSARAINSLRGSRYFESYEESLRVRLSWTEEDRERLRAWLDGDGIVTLRRTRNCGRTVTKEICVAVGITGPIDGAVSALGAWPFRKLVRDPLHP